MPAVVGLAVVLLGAGVTVAGLTQMVRGY